MKTYDLIVIGSGSGLEISSEAIELGMSVAVVEHGPFGGTCLNRGCIPSKLLIHVADVMETIKTADTFGIKATVQSIDWDHIMARAASVDEEAAEILEGNRQHPNIDVYTDTARFVDAKILEIAGQRITAETIVIAAGSHPYIPDIPGVKDVPYITSDEALRLPKQPKKMTVVGGGYIAAELAHFYGAMGTEVTIVHRGPTLVRHEDHAISHRFTQVYGRKFNLLLNCRVERAHRQGDEIVVDVAMNGHKASVSGDALLMATGRIPNTDILDVAKTGV